MKKSLLLAGAAVAAAFVMTGCMSTHTNDAANGAKVDVTKTFTADVTVGQKAVSGEATVHNVLGLFTFGVSEFADDAFVSTTGPVLQLAVSPVDAAKQGAAYKACAAAKADTILAAKYKLEIKDFFVYKCVNCKVTGFPGTVKGVK